MEADNTAENKSVTCLKLPENLDKMEVKKFFSQFGNLKSFILKPSKLECTVEFETKEGADKALNSNTGLEIIPTKPEHLKIPNDYIDPDVQSELQAMLPTVETLIKHPFKAKMYPTPPKQKTEQLTVSAVQSDPRLVHSAKTELENLIKRPAYSAEEKFLVLDARDKLYRVMNTKSTDLKNVTSTKGTCKDMCPEKERLMRVARLQVASFEMDDEKNTMDANRAIKQYSRSSADQEIPLPHELRSEETLKATMTYLLHNIIGLCDDEDVSVADWYHFVWDRTRGIRKDITQQELCSLNTVELLEQCARFHIHCSARLIAEDSGVFDQKINDENLTKSLQTLKYMYDDLKLKNIKCPNEAEFRGYVVLLNLNESGNFLWQIKRLEKDILSSEEMRFALEVYFSVALNNYVKFFNLVREASYMNACILLKYFTQIRLKAIFTIMRSYTQRRGARFAFNLSYLEEILNFESYEATANFMTYYGANCDLDNDNVTLDPGTFGNASMPYSMERALETVEYKLERTVAEEICGGELSSPDCFLEIQPHSSFDEKGFLKKEAFYVEDQNGPSIHKDGVFKVPKESPPVSPAQKLFQQKNIFTKSDQTDGTNIFGSIPFSKSMTSTPFHSEPSFSLSTKPTPNVFNSGSIFGSFTNTPPKFSSNIFAQSPKTFDTPKASSPAEAIKIPTINPYKFSKPIGMLDTPKSNIFSNASSPFSTHNNSSSSDSSSGLTTDQEASLREQAKLERIQKENEAAEQLLRKKLAEKAQQEQEKREAQEKLEKKKREEEERIKKEAAEAKQKQLQEDSEEILEELLDEIVMEKVRYEMKFSHMLFVQMPKDFYEALEYDIVVEQLVLIYQQEQLSYINSTKRTFETMHRNFDHWRKATAKQKRRREMLSNIGCSTLNKSLNEHINAVSHPQQNLTLSNMGQYLSGSPQQIVIPDLNYYEPIDLFECFRIVAANNLGFSHNHPQDLRFVQNDMPGKLFWKLVLSIPLKNEEKSIGFCCFIRKWLSKVFNVSEDENIFKLTNNIVQHSRVSICLRKIQGIECLDEKLEKRPSTLENTNSLVFFCTTADLSESRKRLNNILDKIDNSITVTIIIYKNIIEPTDEQLLRSYFDLSLEPKVNDFEISVFYECREKTKDLRQVLIEGCQFLCENYLQQLNTEFSKIYQLEMQHLVDFFQFYFGNEMWQRIEYSCRDDEEFYMKMSSFNNVIQLYNKCIDKMIGIVSIDCKKLPSMPEEFRQLLPLMDIRIPHGFEYFPVDWKSSSQQKKIIKFLHDMKLMRMQNDKFENFKDCQDKMRSFLDINMTCEIIKGQVFFSIVDKIVQHFYFMQLNSSNDKIDQVIGKMRWLKIFECIVIGKFNEIYQNSHAEMPNFVIYSRKDIRTYTVPWWLVSNACGAAESKQIEPSNKKPKFMEKYDCNEISIILKHGRESVLKADGIIKNSKESRSKTKQDSKAFDQFLDKCEEKIRGMKRTLQDKFVE